MKIIKAVFISLVLVVLTLFVGVENVRAQILNISPQSAGCGQVVTFSASGLDSNLTYELVIVCSGGVGGCAGQSFNLTNFSGSSSGSHSSTFNIDGTCTEGDINAGSGVFLTFLRWVDNAGTPRAIQGPSLTLTPQAGSCTMDLGPNPLLAGLQGVISISNANANAYYDITFSDTRCSTPNPHLLTTSSGDSTSTFTCTAPGSYTITATSTDPSPRNCSSNINIIGESTDCNSRPGRCIPDDQCPFGCTLAPANPPGYWTDCPSTSGNICCGSAVACCLSPQPDACGGGPGPGPVTHQVLCSDNASIYTAIGCIPVESPQEFVSFLLRWGMGIAGGIAIILIVYAGFMIITSTGNPQRVAAGKELLTAAVTGLLLLIFSAFVLRTVGVTILHIPGF